MKTSKAGQVRQPDKGKNFAPHASMAELITRMAGRREGFIPTSLPDVRLMRATRYHPRTQVSYSPGIFIVVQGRKTGYLEDQSFVYDANNFLVLTVPLPFECETEGSEKVPLLAVSVSVHPTSVAELLLEMEPSPSPGSQPPRAIASSPLNADLADAALRLLRALSSPCDSKILGPQIIREVIYRVLQTGQGERLRALAAPHSNFGQISRVLRRMHNDFSQVLDVSGLAREAGMSVSTFHSHFKAITSSSPLQYLKNMRLHKARMLMVYEGESAGNAARRVGYESASQFSREFKRFFGGTPAEIATEMRALLHDPRRPLSLY